MKITVLTLFPDFFPLFGKKVSLEERLKREKLRLSFGIFEITVMTSINRQTICPSEEVLEW